MPPWRALTARNPDVILLTALLSPRDEEELVSYLRTLAGAQHIQTHTIPQLASTAADMEQKGGGGLFGKLLGKKEPAPKVTMGGCDPDLFADEIRTFIEAATERKSESAEACTSEWHTSSSRRSRRIGHGRFGSRPGRSSIRAAPRPTPIPEEQPQVAAVSSGSRHSMATLHCAGQRHCGFGTPSLVTNVPSPCLPKIRKSRNGWRRQPAAQRRPRRAVGAKRKPRRSGSARRMPKRACGRGGARARPGGGRG